MSPPIRPEADAELEAAYQRRLAQANGFQQKLAQESEISTLAAARRDDDALEAAYAKRMQKQELENRRQDITGAEDWAQGTSVGLSNTGSAATRSGGGLARLFEGIPSPGASPAQGEVRRTVGKNPLERAADTMEQEAQAYYDPQGAAGTAGIVMGRLAGEAGTAMAGGRLVSGAALAASPGGMLAKGLQSGNPLARSMAQNLPFTPIDAAMGYGGAEQGFVLPGRGGAAVENVAMGLGLGGAIDAIQARNAILAERLAKRTRDVNALNARVDQRTRQRAQTEAAPIVEVLEQRKSLSNFIEELKAREAEFNQSEVQRNRRTGQQAQVEGDAAERARLDAERKQWENAEALRTATAVDEGVRARAAGAASAGPDLPELPPLENVPSRNLPVKYDPTRIAPEQGMREVGPATAEMEELAGRASERTQTYARRALAEIEAYEEDKMSRSATTPKGRLKSNLKNVHPDALERALVERMERQSMNPSAFIDHMDDPRYAEAMGLAHGGNMEDAAGILDDAGDPILRRGSASAVDKAQAVQTQKAIDRIKAEIERRQPAGPDEPAWTPRPRATPKSDLAATGGVDPEDADISFDFSSPAPAMREAMPRNALEEMDAGRKRVLDERQAEADRIRSMVPEELDAEIATLRKKLGMSDLGEVLTDRYTAQIRTLEAERMKWEDVDDSAARGPIATWVRNEAKEAKRAKAAGPPAGAAGDTRARALMRRSYGPDENGPYWDLSDVDITARIGELRAEAAAGEEAARNAPAGTDPAGVAQLYSVAPSRNLLADSLEDHMAERGGNPPPTRSDPRLPPTGPRTALDEINARAEGNPADPGAMRKVYGSGDNQIEVTSSQMLGNDFYSKTYGTEGSIINFELRGPGLASETGYRSVAGVTVLGKATPERLREIADELVAKHKKTAKAPKKGKTPSETIDARAIRGVADMQKIGGKVIRAKVNLPHGDLPPITEMPDLSNAKTVDIEAELNARADELMELESGVERNGVLDEVDPEEAAEWRRKQDARDKRADEVKAERIAEIQAKARHLEVNSEVDGDLLKKSGMRVGAPYASEGGSGTVIKVYVEPHNSGFADSDFYAEDFEVPGVPLYRVVYVPEGAKVGKNGEYKARDHHTNSVYLTRDGRVVSAGNGSDVRFDGTRPGRVTMKWDAYRQAPILPGRMEADGPPGPLEQAVKKPVAAPKKGGKNRKGQTSLGVTSPLAGGIGGGLVGASHDKENRWRGAIIGAAAGAGLGREAAKLAQGGAKVRRGVLPAGVSFTPGDVPVQMKRVPKDTFVEDVLRPVPGKKVAVWQSKEPANWQSPEAKAAEDRVAEVRYGPTKAPVPEPARAVDVIEERLQAMKAGTYKPKARHADPETTAREEIEPMVEAARRSSKSASGKTLVRASAFSEAIYEMPLDDAALLYRRLRAGQEFLDDAELMHYHGKEILDQKKSDALEELATWKGRSRLDTDDVRHSDRETHAEFYEIVNGKKVKVWMEAKRIVDAHIEHYGEAALRDRALELPSSTSNRAGRVAPEVLSATTSGLATGTTAALAGDPENRERNFWLGLAAGAGVATGAMALAARRSRPRSTLFQTDPNVKAVRETIVAGHRPEPKGNRLLTPAQRFYQKLVASQTAAVRLGEKAGTASRVAYAVARGHGWEEAARQFADDFFVPMVKGHAGLEDDVRALVKVERELDLRSKGAEDKMDMDYLDLRAARTELRKNPEVVKAARELQKYYRRLQEQALSEGLISQQQFNDMVDSEDFYTPFVREWDDVEPITRSSGGGIIQRSAGGRRMNKQTKASAKTVDPYEVAATDTGELFQRIARQRVTNAMVEAYHADPAMVEAFLRPLADKTPAPGARPIEFNVDGKRTQWEVRDPDLYDALASMDKQTLKGYQKVLRGFAAALRTGTTLMPDFVVANWTRDSVGSAVQQRGISKAALAGAGVGAVGNTVFGDKEQPAWMRAAKGAAYGSGAGVIGRQAHKSAAAIGDIVLGREIYKQFKRDGGMVLGYYPRSKADVRTMLENLRRSGVDPRTVLRPKSWVQALQMVGSAVEQSTRLAKYKDAVKAGASTGEAVLAAHDVSVRFGQSGSDTRAITNATAFWNSSVQGWDKAIRMAKNPRTAAVALATITAPSVALWMTNKDDPDYWARPTWERNIFWMVKKNDGSGQFWRIPKPFQIGALFASLPERMLEYAANAQLEVPFTGKPMTSASPLKGAPKPGKTTRRAVRDLAAQSFDGVAPIPTALSFGFEQLFNKDLFRNRKIVSNERVPVEQQFDENTSSAAYLAGKMGGGRISPQRIDHLIRATTGGGGQFVSGFADKAARRLGLDDRPVLQGGRRPLVGRFETQSGLSDTQVMYRERLDAAEKVFRGMENLVTKGNADEVEAYIDNNRPALQEYYQLEAFKNIEKELSMIRWDVSRSTTLSAAQKKAKYLEIARAGERLAAEALQGNPSGR